MEKFQSPLPPAVKKENNHRLVTTRNLFNSIAADLQGINSWRYQRNVSGGVQEYIEAVSFQHYLENQRLITYDEAQALIPGGIRLTEQDYLLGLFDLVGELMRFAITNMATKGALPRRSAKNQNGDSGGPDILTDLRELRACFEGLDMSPGAGCGASLLEKDTRQKMDVMKTSVEKVERAVYGIIIRGREKWAPDWGLEEKGRDPTATY